MLFELRQYRARPGKRDEFVRFVEEEIFPYRASFGETVVGSWVAEDDPDVFIWMRRFDDRAHYERYLAAQRAEGRWESYFLPRIDELMFRDQNVTTWMTATPRSPIS